MTPPPQKVKSIYAERLLSPPNFTGRKAKNNDEATHLALFHRKGGMTQGGTSGSEGRAIALENFFLAGEP